MSTLYEPRSAIHAPVDANYVKSNAPTLPLRTFRWAIAVSCLIVVLLGVMRLPEPLWGDQALFLVGGKAIRDGAVLYRDFWDLKQPGIYGLYALAGSLFGFSAVGVHLVDFLWMGALGLVLRASLKTNFRHAWIADLMPWLCVGTYFAAIDARQQMQVESLAGLPIYLSLWFSVKAAEDAGRRWRWLLLSGVMAGVVVILKLVYLPLLMAIWFVYLLHGIFRQRQVPLTAIYQTVWPLAIGLALPLLPIVLYWWGTDTLQDAFYTQIQHPPRMLQELPKKPLVNLFYAVAWAVRKFLPIIFLAGFALRGAWSRMSLLRTQLAVWLVLAIAMIVAQGQSWWTYHFLLLLVPVSVFAAQGLDELLSVERRRFRKVARRLAIAGIIGVLSLHLMAFASMSRLMLTSAIPVTPSAQLVYQQRVSPVYAELAEVVGFLQRPESLPGDIYVIGTPVVYLLSDRAQALPLIGWIPEMMLAQQWRDLEQQFETAQPNYVFVSNIEGQYIEAQFKQFLLARYAAVQQSAAGVLYQIKARV